MKILAIDYGEKNIGLAISDEKGIIARAMNDLANRSTSDAIQKIHKIANSHQVKTIVVGLPLGENGEETEQSMKTRYFARALENTDKKDVTFWDESFSTSKAEENAKQIKKKNIHSEAARIILQEYLDHINENKEKLI